jgi:transposase-like protein
MSYCKASITPGVVRVAKGVPSFTEQEKERALTIIRQNPQISLADLEHRARNISSTTLARWRKEIQDGTGNMSQERNPSNEDTDSEGIERPRMSDKQRLEALKLQNEDYLRTIKVQNIVLVYLRRYASASDDADRKDIEIQYLIALLAEYGCHEPERLSAQELVEGQ